jgi:hypothetical protein
MKNKKTRKLKALSRSSQAKEPEHEQTRYASSLLRAEKIVICDGFRYYA